MILLLLRAGNWLVHFKFTFLIILEASNYITTELIHKFLLDELDETIVVSWK